MTAPSFPGIPQTLSAGIALCDIDTSQVLRVVTLQYTPETLTRTLQVQGAGGESPDHLEALRLKAPPIETIKLDAQLDATDALEAGDPFGTSFGIQPQLAALETIVYPNSQDILNNYFQAQAGSMEIFPVSAPLQIFIWSAVRAVPVRITDFSITEEAFDPSLNPIRAKVSLTMRVLNPYDLGFDNKGGSLFMIYQLQKEILTQFTSGARNPQAGLQQMGFTKL
jgi:hypothetical protein